MTYRITIDAYPATSSTELRPGKRATEFAADIRHHRREPEAGGDQSTTPRNSSRTGRAGAFYISITSTYTAQMVRLGASTIARAVKIGYDAT